MALSKLTTDMNIISTLPDEPNDVGGLTAAEVKAKFDTGANAIKAYINGTLTEEIDAQKATKEEVQGIVLGQIPDHTLTKAKLATDVTDEIDGKAMAPIVAASSPTTSTVGVVGQFYLNTATGISYQCKAINGSVYTWEPIVNEPIGTIKHSARTDLGDSYLLCNGDAANPANYPSLTSLLPNDAAMWSDVGPVSLTSAWSDIEYFEGVKKLNGHYVIYGRTVSHYAKIFYADSISGPWTPVLLGINRNIVNISYANGYYVALCQDSDNGAMCGYWANSLTVPWTTMTFSGNDPITSATEVVYTGGKYCFVVGNNNVNYIQVYTADAPSAYWSYTNVSTVGGIAQVCKNILVEGSYMYFVGYIGSNPSLYLYKAALTNPTSWMQSTIAASGSGAGSPSQTRFTKTNGLYSIVCANGYINYSTDLITWSLKNVPMGNTVKGELYYNDGFYELIAYGSADAGNFTVGICATISGTWTIKLANINNANMPVADPRTPYYDSTLGRFFIAARQTVSPNNRYFLSAGKLLIGTKLPLINPIGAYAYIKVKD